MQLLWDELKEALPLIFHGNPYLFSVVGFTLEVAAISVGFASLIGLPVALVLGLGRFRGVRALRVLANATLGLPPVAVGLILFLVFVPLGPFGGLHLNTTRESVYIAQTILALPYVVALSAAALQSLEPGLLNQARLLGARRRQLWSLALREARTGVVTAVIAALGTALAEVGAIVVVGGNVYGYDQTLASATLFEANAARYSDAVALALVLMALILVLMGGASLLQHQHRRGQRRARPRASVAT
jgi:tungstate transport system permease protein